MSAFDQAVATRRLRDAMMGIGNRRVVECWLMQWRGDALPDWPSFDATSIADLVSGLVAFEMRDQEQLICTLCGEAVRAAAGMDLVGQDWVQLAEPDQREARLNGFRAVAAGSVGHSMRHAQHRLGGVHYIEEILLPFAPLPSGAYPVLAHIGWRPLEPEPGMPEFRNSRSIPDDIALIPLRR